MFISLILHSDIKQYMKPIAGILSILFSSAIMISCSPEIKLQNNLTRDGGRWNIDEFKTTVVVSTTPDVPVITQTFNVGEAFFMNQVPVSGFSMIHLPCRMLPLILNGKTLPVK